MDATEAGNSAAIKVTALVIEPGSKAFDAFVRDICARIASKHGIEWRDAQAWEDAQPHA